MDHLGHIPPWFVDDMMFPKNICCLCWTKSISRIPNLSFSHTAHPPNIFRFFILVSKCFTFFSRVFRLLPMFFPRFSPLFSYFFPTFLEFLSFFPTCSIFSPCFPIFVFFFSETIPSCARSHSPSVRPWPWRPRIRPWPWRPRRQRRRRSRPQPRTAGKPRFALGKMMIQWISGRFWYIFQIGVLSFIWFFGCMLLLLL